MIGAKITVTGKIGELDDKALGLGVLRAANYLSGIVRKVIMTTSKAGRTGALARSWSAAPSGHLSAKVYSNNIYAHIQDVGGKITPKTVKMLAIPLHGGIAVGKWPRHWGKGQLHREGSILASGGGKGGRGVPQYALVRSVTLPARHYTDAAIAEAQDEMTEIVGGLTIVQGDK